MKNILFCGLFLSMIPVCALADDTTTNAASATNAPSTNSAAAINADLGKPKTPPSNLPGTNERMEVMDINQQLRAMLHGGDNSPEAWDAADARIVALQKTYGKTPETAGNVVLLRKVQLAVAKKGGDQARYDALVAKLATDPNPDVAALAAKH